MNSLARCVVTTEQMISELYAISTVQFNRQSQNAFSNFSPSAYFLNTYTMLRALAKLSNKLLLARIAESIEITLLLLLSNSCHFEGVSKFNTIKIVPAVTCISLSIKFVDRNGTE